MTLQEEINNLTWYSTISNLKLILNNLINTAIPGIVSTKISKNTSTTFTTNTITTVTQAEYDAITVPDTTTLYFIV